MARKVVLPLKFDGKPLELLYIKFVNALLMIVTIGVYYFWAKVRVRKWMHSSLRLGPRYLEWHGNGKELLVGWLKAFVIFGLPVFLLQNLPTILKAPIYVQLPLAFAGWLVIMIFVPFATVKARRYRLGRTSWRGIRFSFRGKWREYMKVFVKGTILSMISLGIYAPYFTVDRFRFLVSNTWYGTGRFGFAGEGRVLLGPWIRAVLLTIPTLGICWFWYSAAKTRVLWGGVKFRGAGTVCTVTGGGLLKVGVKNLLTVLLTLGIGMPWATVRSARYLVENIRIAGMPRLYGVKQETRGETATGEEMADLFSFDMDLG